MVGDEEAALIHLGDGGEAGGSQVDGAVGSKFFAEASEGNSISVLYKACFTYPRLAIVFTEHYIISWPPVLPFLIVD